MQKTAKLLWVSALVSTFSLAAPAKKAVWVDPALLASVGVQPLAKVSSLKVVYAELDEAQLAKISEQAHEWGRCGGYKELAQKPSDPVQALNTLKAAHSRSQRVAVKAADFLSVPRRESIDSAIQEVSDVNVKDYVTWFSGFYTRFNRSNRGNEAVIALRDKIQGWLAGSDATVELVTHARTPQNSVRVRLPGRVRPQEIIVIGGHLDSVNWKEGGMAVAPGADDNASGTSSVLEALRILLKQPRTERTLEFMFYAGEESGLIGSADIAEKYKAQRKDVVAVMQLDMTLFPGTGEFTLGSMTDFTDPWLRQYFSRLNDLYVHAKIIEDECGYGCSDHASWHDEGYPALMPFEAKSDDMNRKIHTRDDVINASSNFRHAAMFSKLAVALALDLGNSTLRRP